MGSAIVERAGRGAWLSSDPRRRPRAAWGMVLACALAGIGCAGSDPALDDGASAAVSDESELASRGVCPADLRAAAGRSCSEGLSCSYPVACPAVNQQARCACEDGRLVCHDAVGPLARGQEARCHQQADAVPAECPAALDQASGSTCDVVGSACFYPGKSCEERSAQFLDRCVCEAGEGGALRFVCEVGECMR